MTTIKCFLHFIFLFTDVSWMIMKKKGYFQICWNLWFDENCANVFIECRKFTLFFIFSLYQSFWLVLFFCCGHSKQSYTSRNRWKQDEAIKFTMPNLKRWVSSWYEFEASIKCGDRANEIKTGSTERLATHLHNLRYVS